MGFSGITPKILTFEYYAKNKTYSEVNFICVYQVCPNWLRNARQKSKMAATKVFFLSFQHQTRWFPASSRSPCFEFLSFPKVKYSIHLEYQANIVSFDYDHCHTKLYVLLLHNSTKVHYGLILIFPLFNILLQDRLRVKNPSFHMLPREL